MWSGDRGGHRHRVPMCTRPRVGARHQARVLLGDFRSRDLPRAVLLRVQPAPPMASGGGKHRLRWLDSFKVFPRGYTPSLGVGRTTRGPLAVPIARRTPECLHLHRWSARGTAPARFGDGASPRPGLTPQIPGGAAATLGDRRVYVKPPEGRLTASDFRGRGAGHRTRCPPDRSTR